MTREELLIKIDTMGVLAIEECMNHYDVWGLRELSDKQLENWIKYKKLKKIK